MSDHGQRAGAAGGEGVSRLSATARIGAADFVVHGAAQPFANAPEVLLGLEILVHIRSRALHETHHPTAIPIFLDHDLEDMTTYRFFDMQGAHDKEFYRSFYDDVYGLLDGVKLGFGEAIISEHLVRDDPDLVIIPHPINVEIPFSLYFNSNKVMTKLHKAVVACLQREVPIYL